MQTGSREQSCRSARAMTGELTGARLTASGVCTALSRRQSSVTGHVAVTLQLERKLAITRQWPCETAPYGFQFAGRRGDLTSRNCKTIAYSIGRCLFITFALIAIIVLLLLLCRALFRLVRHHNSVEISYLQQQLVIDKEFRKTDRSVRPGLEARLCNCVAGACWHS